MHFHSKTLKPPEKMCNVHHPWWGYFCPMSWISSASMRTLFFRILLPADQRDTAMVDEILLSSQPNGNLSELDDSDSKMD